MARVSDRHARRGLGDRITAGCKPASERDRMAIEREMTGAEQREVWIIEDKELRKALDEQLQRLKSSWTSRNRALAITHLEDTIMRLGMDLKELGTENPYPNSYDPTNTKVDPTADGLKM